MLDVRDRALIAAVQHGLPISPRPYAAVGGLIDMPEQEVITRLTRLKERGVIKRLGVVVKHRQLGYQANAMVVWNVPDGLISQMGKKICYLNFVTLCYQRPRCGKQWPYNLYCMIHGKNREIVLKQLERLIDCCGLSTFDCQILFSNRCFKQRGAIYQLQFSATEDCAVYG